MAAIANWTATTAEFPTRGSARDKLGFATKFATYAALSRSETIWHCEIRDGCAELSTAPCHTDESERQAMIHCGVALQHIKLALKRHGCLGRIDFFPDLEQPNLAARIHTGYCGGQDIPDHRLFEAHAAGISPVKSPASAAAFALLGQVAASERSWLEFAQSEASRQRLQGLLLPPQRLQVNQLRVTGTTATRTTPGDWQFETDANEESVRFTRWRKPFLEVKVKPVRTTDDQPNEANRSSSPDDAFAILKTKTDDRHGWLAAGMTLARVLLQMRVMNLACSFHLEP